MSTVITNINSRQVYENAVSLLANYLGITPSEVIRQYRPGPASIRGEVPMSTSTTSYTIPIRTTDSGASTFSTNVLVQQQDIFVASEIGIFVAKPSSATDTTFSLLSYPDPVTFSNSNTATSLNSLYNGFARVTINNETAIANWDLFKHRVAPITQAASNADYTTSGITTVPSIDGSSMGFHPIEPNLVLSGAANIQFQLNLPAAIAAIETNSRIVVVQRGILLQNATSVR